jgi:hypothetical protein
MSSGNIDDGIIKLYGVKKSWCRLINVFAMLMELLN